MAARNTPARERLDKADLEAMAEFRYRLRRFLRFSEEVTHAEGVTPLQYQLMLQILGFEGRNWATVGELAERLQGAPHGTAALVSRCETAGWVVRRPGVEDRRQVRVELTARGERLLLRLAGYHKPEIEAFGWLLGAAAGKNKADQAGEPGKGADKRADKGTDKRTDKGTAGGAKAGRTKPTVQS